MIVKTTPVKPYIGLNVTFFGGVKNCKCLQYIFMLKEIRGSRYTDEPLFIFINPTNEAILKNITMEARITHLIEIEYVYMPELTCGIKT